MNIAREFREWKPRPCPRGLPGQIVITSFGLGTVRAAKWFVPTRGVAHWRYEVALLDGGAIVNCGSL